MSTSEAACGSARGSRAHVAETACPYAAEMVCPYAAEMARPHAADIASEKQRAPAPLSAGACPPLF
ncbi:hypothetical protein ACFWY6_23890 [Streptomyces sp. NPDC059037]|uniref:hypothetical protein n=1 Tax=Streptomyces sp. NPDC059037 TaxID=3346710 RepID=UPI00369E86CE